MKKLLAKLKANKKGFTLVELIVVIAIIGVLALILVPNMLKFIGDSKQKSALANAKTIYNAASAAAAKVIADGGTLDTANKTALGDDFDSDSATVTIGDYVSSVKGNFVVALTANGVTSVTYDADKDGTVDATYTG